jgi:hypothetical protein
MLELAMCGLCGAGCTVSELRIYDGEELCPRCYVGAMGVSVACSICDSSDVAVIAHMSGGAKMLLCSPCDVTCRSDS